MPRRRLRARICAAVAVLVLITLALPVAGVSAALKSGATLKSEWSAEGETVVVQESDRKINFKGRWSTVDDQDYMGGKAKETGAGNAKSAFKFTGAAVAWIGSVGPTHGTARVYIDGQLPPEWTPGHRRSIPRSCSSRSRGTQLGRTTSPSSRPVPPAIRQSRSTRFSSSSGCRARRRRRRRRHPTPTPRPTPTPTPNPTPTPTPRRPDAEPRADSDAGAHSHAESLAESLADASNTSAGHRQEPDRHQCHRPAGRPARRHARRDRGRQRHLPCRQLQQSPGDVVVDRRSVCITDPTDPRARGDEGRGHLRWWRLIVLRRDLVRSRSPSPDMGRLQLRERYAGQHERRRHGHGHVRRLCRSAGRSPHHAAQHRAAAEGGRHTDPRPRGVLQLGSRRSARHPDRQHVRR